MSAGTGPQELDEASLVESAAVEIRRLIPGAEKASILVIAGSGLGGFVKAVTATEVVEYGSIPGIGQSTVVGHAGRLMVAEAGDSRTPVLVMSGRRHLYEGLTAAEASRLARAVFLAFPNIRRMVVSNAAGGLNPTFAVGDLMVISDHVNWMFKNPLFGPNRNEWGPRFPDASDIYTKSLRQIAFNVAGKLHIPLRQGTYVAMHGPSYETRAEVNMLRNIVGADAVGMSTVPEALIAAHMGREVLGISFISNMLLERAVTTHEEVVQNARLVEDRFNALLTGLLPELHALQ